MITYYDALSKITNSIKNENFVISKLKIKDSLHFVSSDIIYSSMNVPGFDNSAMDGFAFKMFNLFDFDKELIVLNMLKAGDLVDFKSNMNNKNICIEIMTGAKIPDIFDTIIKIEDVYEIFDSENFLSKILFKKNVKKGSNIRFTGEDYKICDILLKSGEIINSSHIILLSTFGIKFLNIILKPKIYIICTGKEIYDNCDNYDKFTKGLIFNSSGLFLKKILSKFGFDVVYLGIIRDSESDFISLLKLLLNNDLTIIITTGAVSKGKADFIPMSLKKLDFNVLFHRVNIKPGKPLLFSKFGSNIFFFGLPGNPISTLIGMRFFIYPFLRCLSGLSVEIPLFAKLVNKKYSSKKISFLKSILYNFNGELFVKILVEQESFKISGLINSNCFVLVNKYKLYKKDDILCTYKHNVFF